jgi:phosphatidylglycerophosphate synthase
MLDTFLGRPGSATTRGLDALARALVRAGVTPNGLSYAALALGLVAALLFYLDRGWWALAVLLLSGLIDAVDGRVARLGAGSTPWGGVLDLTFDRIVEAAVLLGIALPHPDWHQPALVLAATWYVNLCVFLAIGAASERHGEKVILYPPGLLERTEALIFALIVVVAPRFAPAAGYIYAALELVTAAQRFRYGRRALEGGAPSPPGRMGG